MDGIPVALMEAMSVGVPVVSTYLSGIPELIIDCETGMLVQPDDAEALAEALLTVSGNADLRHRLLENAAQKVIAEFSLASNTERLRELFHSSATA